MNDREHAATSPDPHDLRCSDSDRESVAETLRTALGEGRIDLDELSERLDRTYAARTYRDLEAVVADLPESGRLPVPRPGAEPMVATRPGPVDRVGGRATSGSAVAIMGGSSRKGAWTVPPSFTAVAIMGGVDLDLRQARFEAAEVTITAIAFWGGVEIIAPPDVAVHVDGVGIMGGFDGPRDDALPPRSSVTIRVVGLALMGGVDVKRREAGAARRPEDQ